MKKNEKNAFIFATQNEKKRKKKTHLFCNSIKCISCTALAPLHFKDYF
jgi:hypothetical protein